MSDLEPDGRDVIEVPDPRSAWWQIYEFALSYDGNRPDRPEAATVGNGLRASYQATGELTGDLGTLRQALFFEQRRYHHFGVDPTGDDEGYVRLLVQRIRELSGGRVVNEHPVI